MNVPLFKDGLLRGRLVPRPSLVMPYDAWFEYFGGKKSLEVKAFGYVCPSFDLDWTQQHDKAREIDGMQSRTSNPFYLWAPF